MYTYTALVLVVIIVVNLLGQSEVTDLDYVVRCQQHVPRSQVRVHHLREWREREWFCSRSTLLSIKYNQS